MTQSHMHPEIKMGILIATVSRAGRCTQQDTSHCVKDVIVCAHDNTDSSLFHILFQFNIAKIVKWNLKDNLTSYMKMLPANVSENSLQESNSSLIFSEN